MYTLTMIGGYYDGLIRQYSTLKSAKLAANRYVQASFIKSRGSSVVCEITDHAPAGSVGHLWRVS